MPRTYRLPVLLVCLALCPGCDEPLQTSDPHPEQPGAPTIAYVTAAGSIGLMYADGTPAYDLLLPAGLTVTGNEHNSIDFSPDGKYVAYRAQNAITSYIYFIRASGSSSKKVAEGDVLSPMWSNDGTRIAYLSRSAGQTGYDLWVYDRTGDIALMVPGIGPFPAGSLDWSPDDGSIAILTALDPAQGSEIHRVDLATGTSTQLTHFPQPEFVSLRWSPLSGQFLTTQLGTTEECSIYRVEADGSAPVSLSGPPLNRCRLGSWTPDNLVLFNRLEDFQTMTAAGTSPAVLHDWSEAGNFQPIARAQPQGPDLVVVDAGTREVDGGATLEIFCKIRNRGNAPSTPSRVYVNEIDPTPPAGENEIRKQFAVELDVLAPGAETAELVFGTAMSEYTGNGIEYVDVLADPKREVEEVDEGNNELRL